MPIRAYIPKTFDQYQEIYQRSIENPEQFWAKIASTFTWKKPWDKVLSSDLTALDIQWFKNGKLNITENCLDRHLNSRGNKLALIWEPDDPKERFWRLTYRELHTQVCKMANVLKKNNIRKGDRVCIYLPMIPEMAVAVLACARIGAVHSVVFAGFSAQSLADRAADAGAKMIITADGMNRGGKQIHLKRIVDEASKQVPCLEQIMVIQRLGWDVPMESGRDFWYHDESPTVERDCPAEVMDSEDPLFILYTSGSTGKPKGIVHTCGGYMVYAEYSFRSVFQPDESDVFWCTADVGWITGHSYVVYGPLLAGCTTLMFEGIPTYPHAGRFWEICDKFGVNIFYTAPTAIRSLMAHGLDPVLSFSLDSLKTIGTVGEPINEEAWSWYKIHIGKLRCPVVDTWWQTETGGIMISSLANATPEKAAHAAYPLPGIIPVLLDAEGNVIHDNEKEGLLCIQSPWPAMMRQTWGDPERYRTTYFKPFPGYYFTGDGAKRDEQGLYRIIGRVDDVINVSGHRFGTAEIEDAINKSGSVVESAVVGCDHEIKGQAIYAFVVPDTEGKTHASLEDEIIEAVVKQIGRVAKPEFIQIVDHLPKTRSGKIMRRILRKIANGDTSNLGDITTLQDQKVVDDIMEGARQLRSSKR
jgi:acetyl-CoA synthetase